MYGDRITLPGLDALVDPAWERYIRALQAAGLVMELALPTLSERLGPIAERPPEGASKATLLDSYYRGEGDLDAGLRRITIDRYVAHHASDRSVAQDFVARLFIAVREIGPLNLIEDFKGGADGLLLRTMGASALVRQPSVMPAGMSVRDALHGHRPVLVRALVEATNELLHQRRFAMRLLPLDVALGVEAYVAVEPTDALILDYGDVLERPLSELREFARWDTDSIIGASTSTRDVA